MEIDKLYNIFRLHHQICTDSRKILPGSIFFALKGVQFNGNIFAQKAINEGAAYAVVDEVQFANDPRCILVDDVLTTLQKLANYHRKKLNIPVLAITGSNGKTTTKELCREVLQNKFITKATSGNLNNHIGVPLTILNTTPKTEFLIVEMGANHQGEINDLCHIAEPDFVMITNIGKAHLEGFGGVEGVKMGKSEMYRYAYQHQGKIFINTDDEVLCALLPANAANIKYAASELVRIKVEVPCLEFDYRNQYVKTQLYGTYNIPNIAFAIAAGEYFGIDSNKIAHAIASYISENNRSQIVKSGNNTIIKDAYNANPSSMKLSIESFAKIKAEQKVLILGDMLELGDQSSIEHSHIIELTKNLGFKNVIFIGQNFNTVKSIHHGIYFTDVNNAKNYFKEMKYKNATILLKGSRGIAVEQILSD